MKGIKINKTPAKAKYKLILEMIAIIMEYCEISKEYISYKKIIIICVYIILCLFTFINYKYMNRNKDRVQKVVQDVEKVQEVKVEEVKVEEVKVEEVKVEEVKVKSEAVASSSEAEENDANTWLTIEDGKTRYKGEWKNGLPNGKGTKHIYKDDSYIYGYFVDGFSEGYGKQTFGQTWEKTQPYYEGEFKRNHYHGKGEYHYGDGDYYKGYWKDSKYHGQGAAYSLRLDRTWIGEYKNDVKGEGNWVKGEMM
jgi:hypothetical protein